MKYRYAGRSEAVLAGVAAARTLGAGTALDEVRGAFGVVLAPAGLTRHPVAGQDPEIGRLEP
jgi:hypothetical protein